MSAASEKGSEISDLLRKTGHPLLEVRSRSLRSVVFKLSNGLISCGQLVNEKEFLAHLLEWFNYDEWVLESQVLTLIGQLAQHEPAARTLVDIGGVEFLSQLRQNCDSSLHSLIDGILEHLLRVPSSSSSATVSSELLQSSFTTEMTTDMGSYTSQHLTALDTTGSTHHSVQRFSVAANDLQSLEVDLTEEVDQRPHTGDSAHIPSTHLNMGSHRGQSAGGEDAAELLMSADLHGVGIQFPYGESGVGVDSRLISGELEETNNNPCEGCLFPWLRLTLKDCHVLATTSSRLQSSKPDTLLRSSQFVHDILFEDFPPELFLQRPAVLKGLLQLSARGITSSPVAASHFALLSLLKLTRKLRTRLNEMRDTPMKLMDRLAVSTEGEVEVDASLGSCDIPSQSHDHLESLTEEILDHLQSEQVSLDQYCHTLITSVAPLLPGYLNKHLTWTASHGDSDATPPPWSMAGGIAVCGQIMSAVMELMKTKTWRANCSTPPNEASLMCQSIDSICSSLNQCLSKWRRLAASSTRDVTPLLQLVCCATLHLSHCLSQLVQDLGLCDKSDYPPWRSCSSLAGVVQELMMNSAIGTTLPHLQDTLLPLFQQLDPANARLYCKVMDMADCFHKMALFLKMAQSSQSEQSAATSEKIGLVLESLPGLWFTCNSDFISKAVNVSLDVSRATCTCKIKP